MSCAFLDLRAGILLKLRLELYILDVVERRPSIVVPLESKTSAGAFPSADEVPSCSLAHLESPSVAGMKGPREQRGQRVNSVVKRRNAIIARRNTLS